jgi:ferric-dicitrate binding protein FerR (iron transport regulator)
MARAYDFFRGATNLNPQHESAWYWRGSAAPTTDDAIASMERVLALNPENATARDALWLLRIKRIRENAQHISERAHHAPTAQALQAHASRTRRIVGAILFLLIASILFLLAVAAIVWTQGIAIFG